MRSGDNVKSWAGDVRSWASSAAEVSTALAENGRLMINIDSDLEAVEDSWRELENSGVCSPYQRFDWISSYVGALPAEHKRSTCVLSARNERGRPMLLLPLVIGVHQGVLVASAAGGKHANSPQ